MLNDSSQTIQKANHLAAVVMGKIKMPFVRFSYIRSYSAGFTC